MLKQGFRTVGDFLMLLLGSGLYSIGVMCFLTPSRITPGGLTGISAILSQVAFGSTGVWVLLLNIPLLLLGFRKFGGKFVRKTAIATLLCAVLLDVLGTILPTYSGDRLLAAIFGGVLSGTGLALVMLRGASTGGIDIAAKLIHAAHAHLSIGRLMLMIDAGIVALAAVYYQQLETAMYSGVALFASSTIMDNLLYGADKGKLVLIVTRNPKAVAEDIFRSVKRGVTVLDTRGGYTGEQRTMLLCAARRQEVSAVLRIVRERDARAFTVVAEAGQIIGEGFFSRAG